MSDEVVFETERLLARRWDPERDLEAFHRIWGDPRVIWWGASPDVATSRGILERSLARTAAAAQPGLSYWAVVEKESGRIVGNVLLAPAGEAPSDVELGYHFAHDDQGKGYATEASQGALAYGFLRLGLPRVTTKIVPTNAKSLRVAAKLGFRKTGEIEHAGYPHHCFELDREEHARRTAERASEF